MDPSGKIYYFNELTNKGSFMDPRLYQFPDLINAEIPPPNILPRPICPCCNQEIPEEYLRKYIQSIFQLQQAKSSGFMHFLKTGKEEFQNTK